MKINKKFIKDVIDELIYEVVIGKNPFEVGDLVKLRPDILNRVGNNQQWRETLKNLLGKTGKVTKIFPDNKHINVKYDQPWTTNQHGHDYIVDTIGIDYINIIPATKPADNLREVNYTITSTGKPAIAVGALGSIARFASENPKLIKQMRNWVKDCQWKEDPNEIDELSDIQILQGVEKHYEGGVRQFVVDVNPNQTAEGVGWGMPKDIAKDPKHTTNKITGKNQRWTVKFDSTRDLKKHGYKGKSKVTEEVITVNEIKGVAKEILKEMWVGWEEEKEQSEPSTLYKYYKDLANKLKDTKSGKIAKEKADQILFQTLNKKNIKEVKTLIYKPNKKDLDDDDFQRWLFRVEYRLKPYYNSFLKNTETEEIDYSFPEFAYAFYQQHKAGLNESSEDFGEKSYIIFAKSGPVTVYYVNSSTQGERMVQNAQSMATKFPNEEKVRHKIIQLKQKYKGIDRWDFEIVATNPGMDVWKPHGPKEFKLGHQVFKPVKKGDEYIVRWAYNGKTLPSYSYYTDDKKDALNTYEVMIRNAWEMNKKNEPPHEPEPQ